MTRPRFSFGLIGLISASILFAAPLAWSQDPGTDAAMQAAQQANMTAMQAAQQANMAAMQATQQANQDAMQASQEAADNSSPRCCGFPLTVSPRFSVKAGSYNKPIAVRLTDKAYGAVIYYTTNGWTPTTASRRYAGPITIGSTTTLQAIAVAPNCSSSVVASAAYKFPGAPPALAPVALPTTPASGGYQIALNVAIPLVFTVPISSQTAQVGDTVSLQLAEDLKAGNVVLAPKGTPAAGKVIQVDHPAMGGLPGEISFRVESLSLHGTVVPLHALRTLAGKSAVHKARGLAAIPGVGFVAAFMHGQDAQIAAGTPVMATLKAGTLLPAPVS